MREELIVLERVKSLVGIGLLQLVLCPCMLCGFPESTFMPLIRDVDTTSLEAVVNNER